MLFDSHAHYNDVKFKEDAYEVIKTAYINDVGYILNASSDIASCVESIALSQKFHFIYAAVGIHPHNTKGMNSNMLEVIADFAQCKKVVAIGEIGLDYYYDNSPKEDQKFWFAKQINLAVNLKLPVIIHDRDAHEDTMNIIAKENAKEVGGVFHCYSGGVEMARDILEKNFYISLGGAVTFKNAKRALEVAKFIPLDRLLIETDCPYMTPEPHRGKRNDSSYMRLVAEKIAESRGINFDEVANATTQNAKRLFGI